MSDPLAPTRPKAVPLILRRRSDKRLYLDSDEFPAEHEFDKDWLLKNTLSGVIAMSEDEIILTLANGRATYRIDRSRMEEQFEEEREDGNVTVKTRQLSTGYWGVLTDSEVDHG